MPTFHFPVDRKRFENTDLFLRLGLSSTLILHENGCFPTRSLNRRKLKRPAFHFPVDGKRFENGAVQKKLRHDYHVISLPEFSSNTNPKWLVIVGLKTFDAFSE